MEDESVKKMKKKLESKAKKLKKSRSKGLASVHWIWIFPGLKAQQERYKNIVDESLDSGLSLPGFKSQLHCLHCVK